MAKVLSDLLGVSEPIFRISTEELERASGHPSSDARLAAEIITKRHIKCRSLGLDPKDTTGKELYYALLGLMKLHDGFLASKLGGSDASDVKDMMPRIKQYIYGLNIPKSVFALRPNVAKQLLKSSPPRRLMKLLGYRSIDSMLKRESVAELYAGLRLAEKPEWLERFYRKYANLKPTDFETRDIEIIIMKPKKWKDEASQFVESNRHNITFVKEMGVVTVLPMPVSKLPGITVTGLAMLLHNFSELRMYSTYFKMLQVRSDFGRYFADSFTGNSTQHTMLAGQKMHWRVIHRYFGENETEFSEVFEPHIQADDMHWRKAEEVLYRLEPALHFWQNTDYVGYLADGYPVSLNLMDVALCYANSLPYEHRIFHHFREALWNEVYIRYMGQETLKHQVLQQLYHMQNSNPTSFLYANKI